MHSAPDEVWVDYLTELQKNPPLLLEEQVHAKTFRQRNAALEPLPQGDARMELVERVPGQGLQSRRAAALPGHDGSGSG